MVLRLGAVCPPPPSPRVFFMVLCALRGPICRQNTPICRFYLEISYIYRIFVVVLRIIGNVRTTNERKGLRHGEW